MTLQGKIEKITEDSVIVEAEPNTKCSGCKACALLCAQNGSSAPKQLINVPKPDFSVEINDIVELDTPPGCKTKAALTIFLLPLAVFFLCVFFTHEVYFALYHQASDFIPVTVGFICMAAVFFSIFLHLRKQNNSSKDVLFIITRKIQ